MKKLTILFLVFTLSACSSPDIHYYTLQGLYIPHDKVTMPAPGFRLEVLKVSVPVQVDSPELVVRRNDTGLDILENDRWSAPLADEYQAAMTDRLERRLGTHNSSHLTNTEKLPVISVKIKVRRFESLPGQYDFVDAVWSLTERRGGGREARTLSCSSEFSKPAAADLNSVVMAHQKVLDELAEVIARTLSSWIVNNGGENCQS
ncbi:PqiC family protein [Pseudomonas viridiflava]|uniref:PqiC family protein n=1 Tax=Pseudomonas viridiflava TaxID=33069 RepID=UPI000C082640|nr:PqiC family protein [Pseudomonas viridiflava]PHN61824.1 hypothetical protein AO275_19965 [Pseudomonas viridiflava]